jgi:tetratricopeptide (TPR) repeat protein
VFIAHMLYGATSLGAQEKVGAQQILEKAVRVAENIKDRRDKAELLHRIALAQVRAGDIAGSKKTLSQALAVVASLKDRNWKDLMFFRVAAAQSMAGDVTQAMDTASKVLDAGRKHDALQSIVVEQARNGNVKEAIRLAHSIDERGAIVLIAWIQAKSKDFKGALNTAAAIEDVNLRSQALVEIAVEQAKGGEMELAVQTLDKVDGRLIPANALYGAVKDLARTGDVRRTKEIAATLESNPPNAGVADALAELGVAQVKLGDDKGALETVSKVSEEFMADALSRVAEAQVRLGNIRDALETVNLLKNESQQVHARCRIAIAQAEAGDPTGALKTFEGLDVDSEDRISVLRDIAVSQIKVGDIEGARRTLDVLAADFGTATQMYALMAIGVAFVKAGKLSDAMKTIAPIEGLMYRSAILRDIALAQAEIGDYPGAWKTTDTIEEKEAKGLALHGIGMAQAKAGNIGAGIEKSNKQIVPFEKGQALLGVAEGILDRDSSEKALAP